MGNYGRWGERQEPRKHVELWGILGAVCISLCAPGPFHILRPPGPGCAGAPRTSCPVPSTSDD
eukprot:7678285-Pyramimonas_sp.AAC.1